MEKVNREDVTLVDGRPVTEDHKELKANGQQKDYVVLSAEERAKGFVRPVRRSYRHVGPPAPKYPLRDLTETEKADNQGLGYEKYEAFPESESPRVGKYWTKKELENKGCGVVTTMSGPLAETYARDPGFYGGTFCCGCGTHYPVNQFIWEGSNDERVGS